MDLRLVICVAVLAFVAVEARSVVNQRCPRIYCEFGFESGYDCRCRRFQIKEINPCDLKNCPPRTTRCEVRGRVGVCVPVHVFPTDPILPIDPVDPVYSVDPVFPVDPVYPVDPVFPVDPILPIDVCEQPQEAGLCQAYMPRYYYNSASRRCERFIYGGCGGNENNFRTFQECSSRCDRKPRRSYY